MWALWLAAASLAGEPPPVDFLRDVQPVLERACVSCHGPQKQKGGLRLDGKARAFAGGASGPAIDPGKGRTSLLIRRLRGEGDEDRMPLDAPALAANEIARVQAWIDAGAPWPEVAGGSPGATEGVTHWAYRTPHRPVLPTPGARARVHPVDAFILARLDKEGLTPSAEAPRDVLLRRVSLDLTGLPPTLSELDAFAADRTPGAYERAVDRLLASPHYGERWARLWLDLARYADSNGYEKDRPRVAWKYRDWVIDAFNRNLSFKRFTIEQIAGDMLPAATTEQRIATGFHRNTLINQEGGIDVNEAHFEVLVDRVATTASVWLGTTLACAQCHNHKFDPFSQKDFYRFMAFFSASEAAPRGELNGDRHMGEPVLSLPTPTQEAERTKLEGAIARLQAEMAADSEALVADRRAWEHEQRWAESRWSPLTIQSAISTGGATLTVQPDGSLLASGANPPGDVYEITARTAASAITAVRVEVLPDPSLPAGGPGRAPDGNFLLSAFTATVTPVGKPQARPESIVWTSAAADEQLTIYGPATIIGKSHDGWAIDPEIKSSIGRRQALFVPQEPFGDTGGSQIVVRLAHLPRAVRSIGRLRLSVTTTPDPLFIVQVPRKDRPLLDKPAPARSPEQQAVVADLHRRKSTYFAPQRAEIARLRKAIEALGITTAMVMQEKPGFERPSALMRVRGSFTAPGDAVYADVPGALPPLPPDAPANRLGLARWLVDDANPLTARVTVNRFWEQLFGRGLVETTEDFGTQAPAPSHPELLDWLATEFVRTGWDVKALLRTLVTSQTYRQSSRMTPQARDRDPDNRLYARGPRFRVEAEMLRDGALFVAGLLSSKIGGASVYPLQPAGIWEVPYNDNVNGLAWRTSAGEDRHRRTLYTFLRRSAPYPFLTTFDGPSREVCTIRRARTNTPLQALNTLNDPVFFEAAQALAVRLEKEGGRTLPERLRTGFRLATARRPRNAELDPLLRLYETERARYASRPEASVQVLTPPGASEDRPAPTPNPERAALTLVANVLLNLDEAVTKE